MKKHLSRVGRFTRSHKILSFIIILLILGGGYWGYKKFFAAPPSIQYVYGTVRKGTLAKTVTGSGQVSAENQLDITSEASGRITSIAVKVGQHVNAGDLIATIDSRDALLDLENAKISLAKLTEPAKPGDITNAENNVTKAYSDAFASISNVFLHFPSIAGGLKDMLYSRTGYLSDQASGLSQTSRNYRNRAATSYENANTIYNEILSGYTNLTKNSPPNTIETMIEKASVLEKSLAEAVKDAQNAQAFISMSQPDYSSSAASAAATSITSWSTQAASDLSSILSARNTIDSAKESLRKLTEGADALDIRSQELAVEQRRRSYEKYFVRAPFSGVIGRIPVDVYDQASNGTVVATISSSKKVTVIPLNEVDAVQVKPGQKVVLTFDAIEDFSVEGTVTDVDLIGTANQGVVTYNVKIAFEGSDSRIRPGMSIDASITTEEKTDVLVIPVGAIKTQGLGRNETSYVEIQTPTGVARQPITTGMSDDTNTEVTSGLSEGDKIVVRTITATTPRSTTPSILGGISGGQRNIIQNANRTGGASGGANVRFQAR